MKQILLLLTFIGLSMSINAQVAGTTTTISTNVQFNESLTNVQLDPSPTIGNASKVEFLQTFTNGVDPTIGLADVVSIIGGYIPGFVNDLANGASFFCSGVSASFGVDASVDVGGYYRVNSVGNADIDIDYPVEVFVEFPEQNTFGCGDIVKIQTSYNILQPNNTNKLKVKTPFINQGIGAAVDNLSITASANASAWFGIGVDLGPLGSACEEVDSWSGGESFSLGTSLPGFPPLINICEDAFGPGANEASLLGCSITGPGSTPLLNLGQAALDYYNANHAGNYSFASFPNQHTVQIAPPDPLPSGLTIPDLEGTFLDVSKAGLNFQALNGGKKLKVSGSKSSITTMSVDLISFLDYVGITTSLSLGGGLGSIDIGDISPTFSVNQDMSFEFDPVIHIQVDLGRSMTYTVHDANGNYSHGGTGQFVDLLAGQYILAEYPSDLSQPTTVNGHSFVDGQFKTLVNQQHYKSINIKFAKVEIPGVISEALVDETTAVTPIGSGKTIMDHTFNISTNNTEQIQSFSLDPENPIVDITYLDVEDVVNLGGGERAVVYKIGVGNGGDVNLNEVIVNFDLDQTFMTSGGFSVECLHSDELSVNNAYDGSSSINLLSGGNTLQPGQVSYIEILVHVFPEVSPILSGGCFGTVDYSASTKAFAISPIGTLVESNFNHCTMSFTAEDIIAEVDLGASIINALTDYAVYSLDRLTFSKHQALSSGNAGSSNTIRFENVSLQNGPTAEIIGDIHAGGAIELIGQTDVIVDYIQTANQISIAGNQAQINALGAISQQSSCTGIQSVPTLNPPYNSSNDKVVVDNNQSFSLLPGDYKEVRLKQNAQLYMQSGVYNIKKWIFEKNGSQVLYDIQGAPVIINIENWITAGKNNLQFIVNAPGSSSDVFYNLAGEGSTHFNQSLVQGNILSPEGNIVFDGESRLEGSCYAEKITFKNNSSFTGHSYLEEININPACHGNTSLIVATNQEENSMLDAELEILGHQEEEILPSIPLAKMGNPSGKGLRNYPNPFTNETTIKFDLEQTGYIRLIVQDVSGKTVATLREGITNSGRHSVLYRPTGNLPSGLYFCSLISETGIHTLKMINLDN